ncbi:MAG: hypothetical protein ACLPY1_11445 [Terracidiphilus sp.]
MVNRLRTLTGRAGIWLTLAPLALGTAQALQGQASAAFPSSQTHTGKERPMPDRLPAKSSIPPVLTIPVEPLGFSAPGPIYLGQRWSFVSLDFLDENRLLFTFRVPGLMHRDPSGEGTGERQIRALVLSLPAGTVTAEALWTVHDRVRYVWTLKDGHFLLRDKDGIEQGDAALNLKPLLHFPGPLLWMEMDPSQQYLVTNSREPAESEHKPGDVPSPPTAQASMTVDGQKHGVPDTVVRILRIDSGQVMLVSRARAAVHLPINSEGYIESLRGNGEQWLMNLNYFNGGSTILGHVNSTCPPNIDFVSQRELLVTACENLGVHKLVAMSTDGHRLWEDLISPQAVWPLLVMAPDGSRLVRETLAVNHEINAYSPLDSDDIKGQLVRVFDAVSGKVALEAPATPALDAGGNVAISPSGRRVALLNAGALEVFDLPPPPALTDTANGQTAH